jgi:hypothetical protein
MNNEIKIFKLVSGEEIIGTLENTGENTLTISKPMIFYTSTMLDNKGTPYEMTILRDWMARSEIKVAEIPIHQISVSFVPNEKTLELYSLELTKGSMSEEIVDGNNLFNSTEDKMQIFDEILDDFINNINDLMEGDIPQDLPPPTKKKKKKKQRSNPQIDPANLANLMPDELKERPMIYLSMVIPPEAIMNLITSGVLEPEQLLAMIDEVKKKKKFTGDEKGRKDFGNKFSDWNPDPKSDDY